MFPWEQFLSENMYLIGVTEHPVCTKHFARCYEDKNEPDIGLSSARLVSLKGAETYTPSYDI